MQLIDRTRVQNGAASMRTILRPVACCFSLLLCGVCIALWIRSYRTADIVTWSSLHKSNASDQSDLTQTDIYDDLSIQTEMGSVGIGYGRHYAQSGFSHGGLSHRTEQPFRFGREDGSLWNDLGFTWDDIPSGLTVASAPLWLFVIAALVVPSECAIRQIRHLRQTHP